MTITPGMKLGRYQIQSKLGVGGASEVYGGRDLQLGRTVAIKVLRQGFLAKADLRQQFELEAKVLSTLRHPNICTLFEMGHQNGIDFLIVEFLEGQTLAASVQRAPMAFEQILAIGVGIAGGLDAAHRAGIIHRDLSPGCIMQTKTVAKLLDLTMSAWAAYEATGTSVDGMMFGAKHHISPEQLCGKKADARSDIYAFGSILYELATRHPPFLRTMAALTEEPARIGIARPGLPLEFERVVDKALSKNPERRWQTVKDMGTQLELLARALSR
ncbi:MAG: serine/threonine-protein kinase [Bryobacteraceae bacterium]